MSTTTNHHLNLTLSPLDAEFIATDKLVKSLNPQGGGDYIAEFSTFADLWDFATQHFECDVEAMKEALAEIDF